jgi:hypothetical protein
MKGRTCVSVAPTPNSHVTSYLSEQNAFRAHSGPQYDAHFMSVTCCPQGLQFGDNSAEGRKHFTIVSYVNIAWFLGAFGKFAVNDC